MMFGAWYREQRKGAGKTQEEVALECHVNEVTLSRIENGRTGVSKEMTESLARAIGVDINEALLRAGHAPKNAFERETEEEREMKLILRDVPERQRPALLKAMRSMAEALTAA